MTRNLIVFLLSALFAVSAQAQTPDGETPASETICDILIGATPGLYGLCVAFNEAMDCQPDASLADPYANCKPASKKLVEIYDRKKQVGDPDMPGLSSPCPCWNQSQYAEIAAYAQICTPSNPVIGQDSFITIYSVLDGQSGYLKTYGGLRSDPPYCEYKGIGDPTRNRIENSQEEYQFCAAQAMDIVDTLNAGGVLCTREF